MFNSLFGYGCGRNGRVIENRSNAMLRLLAMTFGLKCNFKFNFRNKMLIVTVFIKKYFYRYLKVGLLLR